MTEEKNQLQYSEEDLEKKWQNLPFSNDFIFCKVMEEPELPNDRTVRLLYNIEQYKKLDNLALK